MSNNIFRPEVLSPAGDTERFEKALFFGADAIYVGGAEFGMRTAPSNFSFEELNSAVKSAHEKNVKVYLTCNTVPRSDEIEKLPDFIKQAAECDVDALIISDLGTFDIAKKTAPDIDIHISTQAGVTNYATANVLYNMGAKRIVTARELSIEDIAEIRAKIPKDMEIECFVHGAMCMSFSGRCLISNYLTGRDANRGDCAQPCRWKYYLTEETRPGEYFPVIEDDNGTYLMNSRDMCMIEHIPQLVKAGISSFKIEGRAKSAYYTAVITNAYRAAVDEYMKNPSDEFVPSEWIVNEVKKVSYRQYCTGFYFGRPQDNSEIFYEGGYRREWNVIAEVKKCENGRLYGFQRNRFFEGDEIEVFQKGMEPFRVKVKDLRNSSDEQIESAPHAMMDFSFQSDYDIICGSILRKELKY